MSTIDQRVVEMRFDNKQFETGVAETMSTLDKFKQALNLTGATKGLENIGDAARKCDMSMLGTAVDTVRTKFSALEIMGITALANITNSAVNAGKRMASALTIDPIKTGFKEYETQINAVQTILANTQSKGTDLEDVNKALDTLNTYADKTIYNFTEMTRNIGTFTAAGVDLDTSVKSIQGIANLAAVSGSTSQQASTAMYQLSQALASGTVKLMDWNSVVNAGMGGEVFQNALKETAKIHGVAIDEMIESEGSFRETLKNGWLTSEILTETLENFTLAAEKGSKEWDEYKKSLMDRGYSEEQAEAILNMGNTATDAATKVKTFTQLWDTLKEAAQSGWTQTWEIIVGDFEEAKALLTNISDTIGKMIGDSARVRNELLQGWKDAGGRTDLIDGLKAAFEGVMNVIKPVQEAFRNVFPPVTVENLTNLTSGFKTLMERFSEFTGSHANQIKSLFTGIFSVFNLGWSAVKTLAGGIGSLLGYITGFSGSILDAAAVVGDWLTNISKSVQEADILGKAIEKVKGFIAGIINEFKKFTSVSSDVFSPDRYSGFLGVMQTVWDMVSRLGSAIVTVFSALGKGLSEAFVGWDFNNIVNAINGGLITGILLTLKNFTKGLFDTLSGEGSMLDNLTGILDDVRGCFQAYQDQLKAGTLLKIASAIGILAASLFVISTIDPASMSMSISAITMLFAELMASMALFNDIGKNVKGVTKGVGLMIGMSTAILILSSALKKISSIDMVGIAKGVVGIGALMAELFIFMQTAKFDGKMTGTAIGIVILSSAMLIMASAVRKFGEMDWEEIGKGLASIGGLLAELAIFSNLTGNAKHVVSTGVSMLLLGAAMKIFASAVKDFSNMAWEEIGRGLVGMAGALAAVTIAMKLMPTNMASIGVGLLAVSGAMVVLSSAMSSFGGMSWEEIGKGLVAMGGALLALAIGLNLMNGTLAGSAALIIAAGALAILAPVMQQLSQMSLSEIGTSLLALAAAFGAIGIAGYLLTPVIPSILGLAAAFALFGVATLGIGVGLGLVAAGFTALAVALSAGATSIVAALTIIVTGIANLIPNVCIQLANGVVAFAQVIADGAPTIALAIGTLLGEMLKLIVEYVPILVEAGMKLLIGLLQGIANNIQQVVETAVLVITNFLAGIASSIPLIIESGVNLIISFINGMAESIRNNTNRMIDATNNLMDAVIGAIKAYFGNFKDKGTEILSKMIAGVKSKFADFKQAAKDMMSGFIEGVKSKMREIKNAAVNVIESAVDGVKSFLGIASPSKLFREIGRWSDEGLIVGLTKYAGNVEAAATNVGERAYDSMYGALTGISSIFDTEVDYQPTIRPLLDLSNVQNGVDKIGGMFGQPTVALAGITAGGSSHLGSLMGTMQLSKNSNDDVVSAISELRGDFGSLINAIGSMQIRMDSGTVVGELIGKIDTSLGQIASHKGRG